MYTATNPYTSAGSVGGSGSFVGRDTLLRELVAALRRPERSAIMLSGGPGAGRTSALDELAALIEDEDGLGLAVRFDVQSRAFDSLDVVVVALAAAIADAAGVAAPELGQWAEQGFTESWLPWVLDRLPQGQRLVLLIDEFVIVDDSRLRQASGALLPMLGGLIEQHGPELAVVLATDLRNTAAEAAVRKHLPSVMRRQLGVLAEAQAWALVRLSQVDRTLMWTIGAVEAVLERSGGHPAVTQTLCEIVWDRACSSRTAPGPAGATVAMVQAAVPPAMELLSGVFNAMCGGLPAAGRVAAGLLAWSDRSAVSLAELADLLRARGLRNVGRELTEDAARELRRQGVLAADGDALADGPVTLVRVGDFIDFGSGVIEQADAFAAVAEFSGPVADNVGEGSVGCCEGIGISCDDEESSGREGHGGEGEVDAAGELPVFQRDG